MATNLTYIPTTHKFVAVLNKKIPEGNLMNALAHAAVGFTGLYPDASALRFNDYIDQDGNVHASISDNPFIILKADNSNKVRGFAEALKAAGIPYTDFTHTMTVGTYFEQHERMASTVEADLEYYAVVAFAEAEKLDPLTKKFSLWRS